MEEGWAGVQGILTACCAMVTNDREKVIGGDLRSALLGQERAEVESLKGEGDMAADFEGVHYLMPEALQVDTQNLRGEGRGQSPWPTGEDDREAHG